MKDYCCWVKVPDNFFKNSDWKKKLINIVEIGKPMMDMMNSVIDDYEQNRILSRFNIYLSSAKNIIIFLYFVITKIKFVITFFLFLI